MYNNIDNPYLARVLKNNQAFFDAFLELIKPNIELAKKTQERLKEGYGITDIFEDYYQTRDSLAKSQKKTLKEFSKNHSTKKMDIEIEVEPLKLPFELHCGLYFSEDQKENFKGHFTFIFKLDTEEFKDISFSFSEKKYMEEERVSLQLFEKHLSISKYAETEIMNMEYFFSDNTSYVWCEDSDFEKQLEKTMEVNASAILDSMLYNHSFSQEQKEFFMLAQDLNIDRLFENVEYYSVFQHFDKEVQILPSKDNKNSFLKKLIQKIKP